MSRSTRPPTSASLMNAPSLVLRWSLRKRATVACLLRCCTRLAQTQVTALGARLAESAELE